MPVPLPEDLVVATPERVAFSYQTAGLGSRFVAQLVDLAVLTGLLVALGLVAWGAGVLIGNPLVPVVAFLVAGFLVFWGYFIASELAWSGQTLGKRLMRLRVVGTHGEPITAGQAIIRNLVRIVDFLPSYYGIGAVAMFVTSRNQRLGDLAAGTLVVKERAAVSLQQLTGLEPAAPPAQARLRWTPRLDPGLRRFVVAYAGRRGHLTPERRGQLAAQVEPALRQALPEMVAARGALAALDHLAEEQAGVS